MTHLQPLTAAEIARLQDVYAMYPMTMTVASTLTDEALSRKGWVKITKVDDSFEVEPSKAAYRQDNGRACLYDESGRVNPTWKK